MLYTELCKKKRESVLKKIMSNPVEIFTLFLTAFLIGNILTKFYTSFVVSTIAVVIIGLVGEIWSDVAQNPSIQIASLGFIILALIMMYIAKMKAYGRENVKTKLGTMKLGVRSLFKAQKWKEVPVLIWTGAHMAVIIANVILFHYFTTLSLKWFNISMGIMTPAIAAITGIVNLVIVWLENKKRNTQEMLIPRMIGWIEFFFFWVQFPIINLVLLIARWPFHKVIGLTDRWSMFIGLGFLTGTEIVLYFAISIMKQVWKDPKVQGYKPMEEEEEELIDIQETARAHL